MALVDQVLDALAGTEGEMVLFPKSGHAGNSLTAPLQFFIGKRARHAGGRFNEPVRRLPQATGPHRGRVPLPAVPAREVKGGPSSEPG